MEVTFFTARYQAGGGGEREGVRYQAGYKNATDQTIVAVRLGFTAFSVFNEHMDSTRGVSMSDLAPGEEETSVWVATVVRSDFAFHSGVVFVDKVRFADGTIWAADLESIASQMREIQADFDATVLRPRQGGG